MVAASNCTPYPTNNCVRPRDFGSADADQISASEQRKCASVRCWLMKYPHCTQNSRSGGFWKTGDRRDVSQLFRRTRRGCPQRLRQVGCFAVAIRFAFAPSGQAQRLEVVPFPVVVLPARKSKTQRMEVRGIPPLRKKTRKDGAPVSFAALLWGRSFIFLSFSACFRK